MSLTSLVARVRRPMIVTASVAVVVVGFLPLDDAAVDAAAAVRPALRRVVVKPVRVEVFTPAWMEIPKIGMKAPVVPVGTYSDGTMASPTNAIDIGWWSGRRPGEGNALFAAHHDWSGSAGSFYRLGELKEGDEVVVRGEGKALIFLVTWVKSFDGNIDATELLGNDGDRQEVTLVTCGGPFDRSIGHHLERVVARAELLSA